MPHPMKPAWTNILDKLLPDKMEKCLTGRNNLSILITHKIMLV
jgi:hypothetical protein